MSVIISDSLYSLNVASPWSLDIKVYEKNKILMFVIDVENLTQKSILSITGLDKKWRDGECYVKAEEIISKLSGKILKVVIKTNGRSYREYYYVSEDGIHLLFSEKGLKDTHGYFDRVYVDSMILKIYRNRVEIVN